MGGTEATTQGGAEGTDISTTPSDDVDMHEGGGSRSETHLDGLSCHVRPDVS